MSHFEGLFCLRAKAKPKYVFVFVCSGKVERQIAILWGDKFRLLICRSLRKPLSAEREAKLIKSTPAWHQDQPRSDDLKHKVSNQTSQSQVFS